MVGEVEKTLEISKLSRQTAGIYQCVGSNDIDRAAIVNFDVFLQVPANIAEIDDGVKGKQTFVTCSASGNPLPVIKWLEGTKLWSSTETIDIDEQLLLGSEIFIDQNGTIMDPKSFPRYLAGSNYRYYSKLSKIEKDDDETLQLELFFNVRTKVPKLMTCDAVNVYGIDEKIVKTKIDEGIRFSDFKTSEISVSVDFDHAFKLDCNIEGSPKPDIQWSLVS